MAGPDPSSGGISVALCGAGWLLRRFDVRTPGGTYRVEYDGRGIGYESVLIDGAAVARLASLLWFVPRFEFLVGGLPAVLHVRIWPWCTFRAVRLEVAGRVGYIEGPFRRDNGPLPAVGVPTRSRSDGVPPYAGP